MPRSLPWMRKEVFYNLALSVAGRYLLFHSVYESRHRNLIGWQVLGSARNSRMALKGSEAAMTRSTPRNGLEGVGNGR